MTRIRFSFIAGFGGLFFLLCGLGACQSRSQVTPGVMLTSTPTVVSVDPSAIPVVATSTATQIPTLEPPPARVLTICTGREPQSLFLYRASASARNILQAVYDGPFDVVSHVAHPVILTKLPSINAGDVRIEPIQIQAGNLIIDSSGSLNRLAEGVSYWPSGCQNADCAQTFASDQSAVMDQVVVQYHLRTGVQWSDGSPLTADDSVFSYEVAKGLYSEGDNQQVDRTFSYQLVDQSTAEWRGIPGFLDVQYPDFFYSPLPRHLCGTVPLDQLLVSDIVNKSPLGWGPYVIEQWVAGDHITLHKNPNYFRTSEGLPKFEFLVFRLMANGSEALDALLAGECDLLDPILAADLDLERLTQLQESGTAGIVFQDEIAWEQVAFGIQSLDLTRPKFFASKEVRQAVALCIDRQKLVDTLLVGHAQVMNSYLPSDDPGYNPDNTQYAVDRQAAGSLLDAAGWRDIDQDSHTARVAQGVAGVPDGTPFEFSYLVSSDAERQAAAQMIQADLAECGLIANLVFDEPGVYLASGPDGPVFGRRFDMAQFALPIVTASACSLYQSDNIPGPYPQFSKGWGGANASGYSNPNYDRACQVLTLAVPESERYQQASFQAQALFAEELPVLPLYWRFRTAVVRPDFCNSWTNVSNNFLWDLESYDYGTGCSQP